MTKENFLKQIRQYFWKNNFTEIDIPYLNPSLPLEANLYPFKTTWVHQNKKFYLPCSPEMALKEYLSKNRQKCFAISHCFRDLEDSGPQHSPEFLMLEWYEPDKNLSQLITSTKKFINHFLKIDFITYQLPPNLPQNEADFNQYFLNKIEPKLLKNKAVFITGYPSYLSPLAKSRMGKISQRFELYINGIEIANACTENTDNKTINKSFEKEAKYRQKHRLSIHPVNPDFAQNCSTLGLCSGIGLGLDRFLHLL